MTSRQELQLSVVMVVNLLLALVYTNKVAISLSVTLLCHKADDKQPIFTKSTSFFVLSLGSNLSSKVSGLARGAMGLTV